MRTDRQRLQDILQSIEKVERFTAEGVDTFYSNDMVQSAVIYQIRIIGEAAYKTSGGLKSQHGEVPWSDIEGTRRILAHDYFRVDLDIVWSIINDHLPSFKNQVEGILIKEWKKIDKQP